MKIPFSVYDFFGYLASGVVILTGLDAWMGPVIITGEGLDVYGAALTLLAAYILGQTTAQVSKPILEDGLVHELLLPPSRVLMGEKRWGLPLIFQGYYKSLPEKTRSRVLARAEKHGLNDPRGEALFLHAYGLVSKSPKAQARLDAFRNQYGFARNMCLALLFSAWALSQAAGRIVSSLPDHLPWLLVLFSVAMLYRFLKFYRQYSYQLLITYAESKPDG